MDETTRGEVTRLLEGFPHDAPEYNERLIGLVSAELRTVARSLMRHEREDHTWASGDLVNELWIRLIDGSPVEWRDSRHFYRVAARAMRRTLVDHARARNAAKRPPAAARVGEEALGDVVGDGAPVDIERLDALVRELNEEQPRAAAALELRIFAGLDLAEIGQELGVTTKTVSRDLEAARTWLEERI